MKPFPRRSVTALLAFTVLGIVALQAAPEQPDPIVGKWEWHHHATATFNADGTCVLSDGITGEWHAAGKAGDERAYAIDLGRGRYKDKLIFNKDGQSALLIGNSGENYTVSRTSNGIVGKWNWHHGETATFDADGSCDLGNRLQGTWQCSSVSPSESKFTIIWEQGRFTDHLVLNGDGQPALLIGSYRENYTVSRSAD